MILRSVTSMRNHLIFDILGDLLTKLQQQLLLRNVAKPCFLLKLDLASVKLGITDLSASPGVQ